MKNNINYTSNEPIVYVLVIETEIDDHHTQFVPTMYVSNDKQTLMRFMDSKFHTKLSDVKASNKISNISYEFSEDVASISYNEDYKEYNIHYTITTANTI